MFDRSPFADTVRKLSKINNWRGIWTVAQQWLIIGSAAALAIWSGHWLVYLLVMILIASRQQALAILMHDGAHYRLFTNRLVNNIVSDLFLAFPVGFSTTAYRRQHLQHHQYTWTDQDPDFVGTRDDKEWQWPKSKTQALKIFIFDLIGLGCQDSMRFLGWWSPWIRLLKSPEDPNYIAVHERLLLLGFVISVLLFLTLTNGWFFFLLLWIIPILTFGSIMMRLRSIGEHLGLEHENELNASRDVIPTWLERLLITPCHVNYHLTHHLFPSVPHYNLPKLHRQLMQDKCFKQKAHVTKSYTGLFSSGILKELIY